MSVEVWVFFRGKLPGKPALARVLRELELPLRFTPPKGSLDGQSGFLPMTWDDDQTGFEFDVYSDPAEFAEYRVQGIDPAFDRCAALCPGGDMAELFAAQAVAAALATLTGGTVYDPEGGRLRSLDEAIADARGTLDMIAAQRKRQPRGTRPADLRHYLKPLLKERRDLVLQGRRLFIRSGRHFLRSVWLGREDQFRLSVALSCKRLYLPPDESGARHLIERSMEVWQPYFQEWLIDAIEHAFELAQQTTNLAHVADHDLRDERLSMHTAYKNNLLGFLLAGERDRAEELILRVEREGNRTWAAELRVLLARDIDELCAEAHEQEARTAEALKLGGMWQPAPFPVEVAGRSRREMADELPFTPVKWPVSRQKIAVLPPSTHGEVQFAHHWTKWDDQVLMVAPLTPDQARALHDNRESYCLFARLPSGELLLLDHKSSWSPHNPDQPTNPNHQPITDLTLWIFHEQRRLIAEFCDQFAEPGTLDFRSVSDQDLARKDEEAVNLFLTMGTWRPAHHRERDLWDQPITNAERALMRIPSPQFGQYEPLIAAANRWLEHGGAERSQLGRAP